MRRLALVLAAFFAMTGIAHAGCTVNAGLPPVLDVTSTVYATPSVHCTVNNGIVYELRTYIQTDTGPSQSYRIDTYAVAQQIYNAGRPIPNYWSHQYTDHWPCSQFSVLASRWRVKAVLENAVTNSVSVSESQPSAFRNPCNG